jgi:uncharacterized protein YndB with AHSA1/START domain
MSEIVYSVDIDKSPEEVFAYLTDDVSRHSEWEGSVIEMRSDPEGPARPGTRLSIRRRVGRSERRFTTEITDVVAPRTYAFRGVDGPIRAVGRDTVEPLPGGGSRVTARLDFEGHGVGRLLVPFVRRAARKEVPADYDRLKERLEAGLV